MRVLLFVATRLLIGAGPDSPSTFLLLVQEKSTQKRKTPGDLSFGFPHPSSKTGSFAKVTGQMFTYRSICLGFHSGLLQPVFFVRFRLRPRDY